MWTIFNEQDDKPTPSAALTSTAAPNTPNPNYLLGSDTSHWDGVVNWNTAISRNIAFNFAKATEGVDFTDSRYAQTHSQLTALDVPSGAYHFFLPDVPGAAQANHFLSIAPDANIYVIDIERAMLYGELIKLRGLSRWTKQQTDNVISHVSMLANGDTENLETEIQIFLDIVTNNAPRRPIIYTSPAFWSTYIGNQPWALNYDLWIANYTQGTPIIPAPWSDYGSWPSNPRVPFWQWTDDAPGAYYGAQSKSVDLNYYRLNNPQELRQYFGLGITTPPNTVDLCTWAQDVHNFLTNSIGYTGAPPECNNTSQPYNVIVSSSRGVNIRSTPAGNIIGSSPYGSILTIYPPTQRAYFDGIPYTWGQIHAPINDGWIALENTRPA